MSIPERLIAARDRMKPVTPTNEDRREARDAMAEAANALTTAQAEIARLKEAALAFLDAYDAVYQHDATGDPWDKEASKRLNAAEASARDNLRAAVSDEQRGEQP